MPTPLAVISPSVLERISPEQADIFRNIQKGMRKKQHHHQNVYPLDALCKTYATAPKRQST
jgi:hypothetical protein